jgi:hypothetical protein
MNNKQYTRKQFFSRAKYSKLSMKEKEQRWQQYRSSQKLSQPPKGMTRSTRMKVKQTPKGKHTMSLGLSHCAANYLVTLTSPFGFHGEACIPDLHAVPSKKVRVKARGTFSTGANGEGSIVLSPWCNANTDDAFSFTLPTYVGGPTIPTILTVVPGTGRAAFSKLPYGPTEFVANSGNSLGVRARTVATAIRIRYIGPELARSGQVIGFRHPDNNNVVGKTYDELRSLETSKTFSNKRQWIYANYVPTRPEEYRYSPNQCTASDGNNYKWSLGFAITGTTTSVGTPGPAPFEWEAIKFVEFIGNIDNITRTHTDVTGMSHVRNSLPEKSVHDNLLASAKGVLTKVGHSLQEAAPIVGAGVLANHLMSGEEVAETALAGAEKETVMGSFLESAAAAIPYVDEAAELLPMAFLL